MLIRKLDLACEKDGEAAAEAYGKIRKVVYDALVL